MLQFMVAASMLCGSLQPGWSDSFDSIEAWKPIASEGVSLKLARDDQGRSGGALRIDFDYRSHAGYVLAERKLDLDLPDNYEFSFWVRGECPSNNLEFKLMDDSGDNVWWSNRVNFAFPKTWQRIVLRKRHIRFAWGPLGGGDLKKASSVQFGVAANSGGKGTVWIDDFSFRALPPVVTTPFAPLFDAAESATGTTPDLAGDGKMDTACFSGPSSSEQRLTVDLGGAREMGGLSIDWVPGHQASDADIETSLDGAEWETAYSLHDAGAERSYIFLPDHEARYIRLRMLGGRGPRYGIREFRVEPIETGSSLNKFFQRVASDVPRNRYPRYLHGEQSYFNVVGTNGGYDEALISADGQLEVGKLKFSIEPFLFTGGRLLGWSDGNTSQGLIDGYLPLPWVRREAEGLRLQVSAFKMDAGKAPTEPLYARYVLTNASQVRKKGRLYLAIRPLLVNPPWFDLNTIGGVVPIRSFEVEGGVVVVNDQTRVRPVGGSLPFGAASFDQGDVTEFLAHGVLPPAGRALRDAFGHASGALAVTFDLAPGASVRRTLEIDASRPAATESEVDLKQDAVVQAWRKALSSFDVTLPGSAQRYVQVLRSNLAYIMVNRDGPGIQPGSRCYERSWIRDGSLTSAALLRMGRIAEAKAFIEWYAKYQFPSGAIPCVVDRRGAEPLPEHDSHGQFIFAVMEVYRFTKDRAFLRSMYPRILKTVEHIQYLRAQRMTPEYAQGDDEKRAFYGLVPESISHEGYSAKPMHSYWDGFFVLKGLKDATEAAQTLGDGAQAKRLASIRDDFAQCLYASMRLAMKNRKIDTIPGCVELGDFDPTSTAIGVYPCGEAHRIPQPQLKNTFDKYAEFFDERASGQANWDNYTPYEIRICNALLMLGQPERAFKMLDFFFRDIIPQGWNHWAEVVTKDPRTPRYLGDMPHTWVGSEYVKYLRNVLVCERESDRSLLLGLGIPARWIHEKEPIQVRRLASYYGPVSYTVRAQGRTTRWTIPAGPTVPPGGVWVRSPIQTPVARASVDGKAVKAVGGWVKLTKLPASVIVEHGARP